MISKLLIIDDHEQMRHLVQLIVRDLVQMVYECDDGSQALAAYALYRPDWVLMDIEMREMDGLTATASLRRFFPNAKIIIITRYDDQHLREAARQAGACAYILKENLSAVRPLLAAA